MNKLSNLQKILFIYGSAIIIFCCSLFIFTFISQLYVEQISKITIISAFGCTIFYVFWVAKNYLNNKFIPFIISGLIFMSMVISIWIARQFFDLSYDGQAYHGEALVELIDGSWNPLINKAEGYNGFHVIWMDSYPKASWFNGVSLYQLTGNFEDIKAFNVLTMFAGLAYSFLAFSFFRINIYLNILLTFLAVFNPITVLQYNGLLLDGQIANLLWILFCSFIISFKAFDRISGLTSLALIILLLNIKTAGLIYFVMSLITFALILYFKQVKNRTKIFGILILGLVLGFAVFGFNPYLTNTYYHQNPIYPSLNKKVFDFTENTPKNYRNKNNLEIFFSSIFFETDLDFNERDSVGATLKAPWKISEGELDSLKLGGLKKGGFGPLFGASFILVMIPLLIVLTLNLKKFKITNIFCYDNDIEGWTINFNQHGIYLLFTLVVFISCAMTSTSNTFRYIPQFWLWLVVSLGYMLVYHKSIFIKILSIIASLIMILNISICFYYNTTKQFEYSKKTRDKLQKLAISTKDNPLDVFFGYASATRLRFTDNGINFVDHVEPLTCKNPGGWNFLPENEMNACEDLANIVNSSISISSSLNKVDSPSSSLTESNSSLKESSNSNTIQIIN